jgi:hypothetical protein
VENRLAAAFIYLLDKPVGFVIFSLLSKMIVGFSNRQSVSPLLITFEQLGRIS